MSTRQRQYGETSAEAERVRAAANPSYAEPNKDNAEAKGAVSSTQRLLE